MENEETKIPVVDIEALKKELEDFIAVAKKEKEKIESLSSGITTKSEELELYYKNFSELRTKLADNQTGMQALLDQSTNLKNQIDQVGINAQTQLDQITEKTNSINVKIQEIEGYFGTFTELKTRLSDGQTGLQALLDQSTALKGSIDDLEKKSKTALDNIYENSQSISEKVTEITTYYESTFLPLRKNVDDPKIGIQATLNLATDLKDEIVKAKTSVDQRHKEIQTLAEKSGELKQNAEGSVKEIESLKAKSIEFKDSIGETLDLVTASSLTDSFVKRRDTIAGNTKFWRWATLLSVLLLGASVLYIYYLQNKAVDGFQNWHSWYRYLFTSPLIYLVYLCSKNYTMERNYEERYAFKTVLSTSLQAYIKLLSDKFSDKKDELLSFTLTSIDRIYKEPYEEKDETNEVYGGIKNIFNFGAKNHVSKPQQSNKAEPEQPLTK
jgi:predicted  nucleic acid-binding Zn-ribbon protein